MTGYRYYGRGTEGSSEGGQSSEEGPVTQSGLPVTVNAQNYFSLKDPTAGPGPGVRNYSYLSECVAQGGDVTSGTKGS